jgi:BioD-like phosphotransacetylase family protein
MSKNSLFIAATGQNVGKTTLCLGMLAALKARFGKVGFIKPVGQRHEVIDNQTIVDKDVVLFKKHFHLNEAWTDMSPVIIPNGFTRDFIDKKVTTQPLQDAIIQSFNKIQHNYPFTLVEGTGHVGVGSVIGLSNAKVAKMLNLDMIIIAPGGLGSSHDELALNIALCKQEGVKVRGVILNKVHEEKREMILDYFPRSFPNLPLFGVIPFHEFLSNPTMRDFEGLFNTSLIAGEAHHYRHFKHTRLAAGSLESFGGELLREELIITPANREDIIQATLQKHKESLAKEGADYLGGLILTGQKAPGEKILEEIREVDIPVLYTSKGIYEAMKLITSYIAKIRTKDVPKIELAIELVKKHLDFDKILS